MVQSFTPTKHRNSAMTLHMRSKDKLDILAKESTDSNTSMESIELKQIQQQQQQRAQQTIRASSPPATFVALVLIAAAMILSPTLSSPTKRSLLEQRTPSLRTQPLPHSVANVVHSNNQKVQIVQRSAAIQAETNKPPPFKPTILIHIGPPKTGTTTLQCHLGLNFETFKAKNFYYLGTWHAPLCGLPEGHVIPGLENVARPMLLDCYAPHVTKECNLDERWNEFGDLLKRHYSKGHNLILSDEMFHHHFKQHDVQRLKGLLENWNVKILYTYRHFYSSVPSMYHQLNDPYATEKGMANAVEKGIWPNDGGYRIQSFRDSNTLDIQNDMRRFRYWVEEFGTVQVFNMESTKGGGGYLSSFLCTMMPELQDSSSCDESITTQASDSLRNDNVSAKKFLHYDMLAVAAKDAGLLDNTSLQRVQVRDAVQQHCEQNGWKDLGDFALDCLSDQEMEGFLQASLDQAKTLQEFFVPSHTDWPLLESEIKTGFAKHAERHQFCSIDTQASLQEERWKSFFANLVSQHQEGGTNKN